MIFDGVVSNLALWDQVSLWNPIKDGQCDTLVDVSDHPEVSPGWTWSSVPKTLTSPDLSQTFVVTSQIWT